MRDATRGIMPATVLGSLLTVTDQRIAQRRLERTKPRFVILPLVQALAEDWLANLF